MLESESQICTQCFSVAVDLGEVCDGFRLICSYGEYIIVQEPYHWTDNVFTFDVKPYPDPDAREQEDVGCKWSFDMMTPLMKMSLPIDRAYELGVAAVEAGWRKEHGHIFWWIANRCGELVEQWEMTHEGTA